MKNLSVFLLILFLGLEVFGQSPNSFRYQAVARDNSGNVLSNQAVSFRISILSGSISGTTAYSEIHSGISTNSFGLVGLDIGKGSPQLGTFSSINWGDNSYYVKVEMDPAGGTAYQALSTSQLLSVPYALHAQSATNVNDADADPENEIQELSLSETQLSLNKNGGTVDLSSIGGGLSLPYNGSLNDTGAGISIINDNGGAISGMATASWGNVAGVYGTLLSNGGAGVFGSAASTSGSVSGVVGETASSEGTGVHGYAHSSTGVTKGVFGQVKSASGFSGYFEGGKFYISGNTGIGTENPSAKLEVAGQVKIIGGSPGMGKVLTSDENGLAEWKSPSSSLILPYTGNVSTDQTAFYVENSGFGGTITGYSSNTSYWFTTGIMGISKAPSSAGVYGKATDTSGPNYGVYGWSLSESGCGAFGKADASTGTTIGVKGSVISSAGYSGYFEGGRFYVNSNMGIGVLNPVSKLEIDGQIKVIGGNPGAGKVLTSDANGLASWEPVDEFTLPYNGSYPSSGYVFEINNSSNGNGLKGQSSSGIGIFGYAEATGMANIGVLGETNSLIGTGVWGNNTNTSGSGFAVKGSVDSPDGYSGYFERGRFYIEGNTGIGIESPTTKLDVNGQIKIRGGSPGAGKVLTSDASGLATWQSPVGGSSLWTATGSNIYFTTGNVGIGTSSPTDKLEVKGNIILSDGVDRYIALPDGSHSLFIGGKKGVPAAYAVQIITNSGSGGVERMTIKSDKVGIGTTSPTQNLDVNGNTRIRGIGSGAYTGVVNRTSDGTLTTSTSDIRLKENIKTLKGSLEKVMKLRGVNFTWKNNPEYGNRIGFIAQEFEEVIPELVFTNPIDGYKGINYAEVGAVLVEAIKELKAENERLMMENEQVKARLEKIEELVGIRAEK